MKKPHNLNWLTFWFTLVRIVPSAAVRMIYPFLLVFGRGMGVGLPQMSMAVSARESIGLFTPLFTTIADRFGRKTGMLLALLIFIAGGAAVLFSGTYTVFIISMCLLLLGLNILVPSMHAYMGDRVPYEKRGGLMGITETSWALAFILGMPLIGLLISQFNWQAPFVVFTILGVLTLGWVALYIKPDEKTAASGHEAPAAHFKLVVTCFPALAIILMSICFALANECINLVFGVWMEDAFGLKIAALGVAAAVLGVSDLLGELLSGGMADRLGKERTVGIGIIINGLVALAMPWLGQTLWGAMFGLFLFYFSFEISWVSTLVLMTEVLPEARATMMGAGFTAMSLGRMAGAGLAPILYSYGFTCNALAALVIDVLALLLLTQVRVRKAVNRFETAAD